MIDSIEYNGFTFDTDNASIQGVFGNGFPTIVATEEAKSQQAGAVPTGYQYRSRTFGWGGDISDSSVSNYLAERNSLATALNLQNQPIEGLEMTFNLITGDAWTMKEVRLVDSNLDFPENEPSRIWNSYQVTFRATRPFFLGTETDETQQVTSSAYGVVVPAPVPAPLTSTVASSSPTDPLTVTNNGSANAHPVFTITGPGTNFTISNSTTGHSMTIETTKAAGESISIDIWNRTITSGGSSLRDDLKTGSSWIYLQPGTNTLTFSVDSGSTTDTQLRTVFNDTYITL